MYHVNFSNTERLKAQREGVQVRRAVVWTCYRPDLRGCGQEELPVSKVDSGQGAAGGWPGDRWPGWYRVDGLRLMVSKN